MLLRFSFDISSSFSLLWLACWVRSEGLDGCLLPGRSLVAFVGSRETLHVETQRLFCSRRGLQDLSQRLSQVLVWRLQGISATARQSQTLATISRRNTWRLHIVCLILANQKKKFLTTLKNNLNVCQKTSHQYKRLWEEPKLKLIPFNAIILWWHGTLFLLFPSLRLLILSFLLATLSFLHGLDGEEREHR